MSKQEHLDLLHQGSDVWNRWRQTYPDIHPDLNAANLRNANLRNTDLRDADLRNTDLRGTNLCDAILNGADLRNADLQGADLSGASLIIPDCTGANLTDCKIYGISAWGVRLDGAQQHSLIITPDDHPIVTVDNLEIALLLSLFLANPLMFTIVDIRARRIVLIAGCFHANRKIILETLNTTLREYNYLPVVVNCAQAANHELIIPVATLATLSRFVIADHSQASNLSEAMQVIVPHLSVPLQPLLDSAEDPSSLHNIAAYDWVLPHSSYTSHMTLQHSLKTHLLASAEQKAQKLEAHKC